MVLLNPGMLTRSFRVRRREAISFSILALRVGLYSV